MPTKKKNNPFALFYSLLSQMNGANKEDLVWKYSNFLTNSLSEFMEQSPKDYQRMIADMQKFVNHVPQEKKGRNALIIELELKKRRSAILLRLQKYGINTTDWNAVNKFMRNPKIAGKTLGEMSIEEMDSLIPKLESILIKDKANVVKKLAKRTLFCYN